MAYARPPPSSKASRPKQTIKYGWTSLEADETLAPATAAKVPEPRGERSSLPDVVAASAAASPHRMLSTTELVSAVGGVWRAVGYRGEKPREESTSLRCVGSWGDESGSLVAVASGELCKRFDLRGAGAESGSEAVSGSDCEQLRAMKKCLLFGLSGPFLPRAASIQLFNDSAVCRERASRSCRGLESLTSHSLFGNRRAGEYWQSSTCSPASNPQDVSATMGVNSSDTASLCRGSTSNNDVGLVKKGADSCSGFLHAADSGAGGRSQSLSPSSEAHITPVESAGCILSHGPDLVTVESSRDSSASSYDQSGSSKQTPPVCFAVEDQLPAEIFKPVKDKLSTAFANKKHAVAGALAGTFVSLCLHPVDTVKTVIQARSMHTLSFCDTFRTILSERGVMGLYRGIASNIASSAPTSAVYTFTYETVKVALLPHLPKECKSLAHCTAGGCASVATSFIFTPSERIKQQMQIRSHYQNCWTALIGILEKGGFPSLYAGWTAVLCRNIPHSIIKFYTYEKLKQLLPPRSESNDGLNTLQTLVCGGVAGSTAALFTTPFDVVKTRLQTQGLKSKVSHVCLTRGDLFHIIRVLQNCSLFRSNLTCIHNYNIAAIRQLMLKRRELEPSSEACPGG